MRRLGPRAGIQPPVRGLGVQGTTSSPPSTVRVRSVASARMSVADAIRGQSPEDRERFLLDVFDEAFHELAARDSAAFRGKFRKMSASAFAFYRGSACLFYADVARDDDPFATGPAARVWIQGDLHAANFGTYMNSEGRLVFDVNDFDEAYVGPFTWDLRRLAASLALLGYEKALSDEQIADLITTVARSYIDQVKAFAASEHTGTFALTLDNTDGTLLTVLQAARLKTRVALLDELTVIDSYDRRFQIDDDTTRLDADTERKVRAAFDQYLTTIPEGKLQNRVSYTIKDIVAQRGVGIGSAGLPSFNVLVEGHTEALENDIVIYMKQSTVAAPSRVVRDNRIRDYFQNEGHRTVVSQRALQAYSDPWLGYTELDGAGQLVAEVGPYANDLDWSDINDIDAMRDLLGFLGRAVAKIHCVSDTDSDQTLIDTSTDQAISQALAGREDEFVTSLVAFGQHYGDVARTDHQIFIDAFRNHRVMDL
jgi:uncharacterized protein (DUF2252 family)